MLQRAGALALAENPFGEDLPPQPGGTSPVALEQPRARAPAAPLPVAGHLLQS